MNTAPGIPPELPDTLKELITEIVWGSDNVETCLCLAREACRLQREADISNGWISHYDYADGLRATPLVVPKDSA